MSKYVIYAIRNTVTDTRYIGLTSRLKRREKQHYAGLKAGTHHNVQLQSAYDHFGRKTFVFEVIERGLNRQEATNREIFWIDHFDSFRNGYNMTKGGDMSSPAFNAKPCTWNGINYPSIAATAQANGVTPATIKKWLSKGYTCDDDVLSHKQGVILAIGRNVSWNGVQYPTIRAAAIANSVAHRTMVYRIEQGYTCDDDIPGHERPVSWNGIEYDSILGCAKANGVEYKTMCNRIYQGYICDEDLQDSGLPKPCTWDGVHYESIASAARALGISSRAMQQRIEMGHKGDSDLVSPHAKRQESVA